MTRTSTVRPARGLEPPPVNLLFHGIGRPRRELEPDEEHYWVTTDFLSGVLDLEVDLMSVRLSFDDCNASDVDIALPALVSRGLTATFFPISDRIGTAGSLSAGGIAELVEAGMTIGTHGRHHVPWRRLSPGAAVDELVTARRELESLVQRPVTEAACPFGAYEHRSLRAMKDLGYSRVFTSDEARAPSSSWLQPRYTMRSGQTVEDVRRLVVDGGNSVSRSLDRVRIAVKGRRWW